MSEQARLRLDAALVSRGIVRSRELAVAAIRRGEVTVNGAAAGKPSQRVADEDDVRYAGADEPWVGRAAYKLVGALEHWPELTVAGARCLDVGASTGGFTQVLLSRSAAHVTALDVGHHQLVTELRDDPRVTDLPGTNMREVARGDLGAPFDVIVGDLSFISLRLVVEQIAAQLASDGWAVLLVKPQFEVGRERLARTGVVTSADEHRRVLVDVLDAADDAGLHLRGLTTSPLPGGDGNTEFLALFAHVTKDSSDDARRRERRGMIEAVVGKPARRPNSNA